MAARVVSGERRASAGSCPAEPSSPGKGDRQLGRRVGTALLLLALAGLVLVVPPLGSQPAIAATPSLTVSLTQSSSNSRIGASITLTATVAWPAAGAALPPGGLHVEFAGTGDGGWSSGPVPIGDGTVSIERTSPVEQTETITARLANSGCSQPAADTVTHTWWRPVITIDQLDARTVIGTPFTLNATLSHDNTPIGGARLRLTANDFIVGEPGIGAALAEPLDATTDSNGVATFEWSGTQAVIEVVDIVEQGTGGAVAKTSHTWLAGAPSRELTVSVEPPIVRTGGGPLAATATLTENGDPVVEATVQFWRSPNNDWVDETTDENGRATHAYSFAGPLGIVPAFAPGAGLAGARFDSWTPTITLSSPDSRSVNGTTYRQMATVTRNGLPVPGISLAFQLFDPASPETPFVVIRTTNDQGRASVDVPAPADPGSYPIEVVESGAPGTPVSASTTHQWLEAPDDVSVPVELEQTADNSRAGNPARMTAHVTSREQDLQGWEVRFAGAGLQTEVARTGRNGRARTQLNSAAPRFPGITASVTVRGCGTFTSRAVFHEWWKPTLVLQPRNQSSPPRRDVQFRATLYRDLGQAREAVTGQAVRFTLRNQDCSLADAGKTATTGSDGVATVTLSRDGPAFDTVVAEEVGVADPARDETNHTWGPVDAPPVSVSLTQSSESSRAGTAVTFTATVHDSDRPSAVAPDVPVRFTGSIASAETVRTDGTGEARLTFTGTSTAPDTITAGVSLGCARIASPPVTHRWWIPELTLDPTTATTTTGTTAGVAARLRHGDSPVPNEEVQLTIDGSSSGQAVLVQTGTTGADGTVLFSWTRSRAGVDDLIALESVDVRPQTARATHTWTAPAPPVTPPPVTAPPSTPTRAPSTPTEGPTTPSAPTSSATTSAPPTEPSGLPSTSTLVKGPEVGRPGGDIEVGGTGCRAGQALTVRLGDHRLGTTRAAADGTFYLRSVVPDLPLGRYRLQSSCGTTIGDPNVDITAPQVNKALAGIAAIGATTASTFVFFLLVAKGIISFLPRRPL